MQESNIDVMASKLIYSDKKFLSNILFDNQ